MSDHIVPGEITTAELPDRAGLPIEPGILTSHALAAIRARADAATQGEWAHAEGSWVIASSVPRGASRIASGEYGDDAWRFYGGELICESISSEDAEFVAHARADIPALLDHIDYLTDAYEQLVRRGAQEADRAQALVLQKDEELAAHDDLHRAAARRIESLMMEEIRLDWLLGELRSGRMPQLATFTRKAIDRAIDEATKPKAARGAVGASL